MAAFVRCERAFHLTFRSANHVSVLTITASPCSSSQGPDGRRGRLSWNRSLRILGGDRRTRKPNCQVGFICHFGTLLCRGLKFPLFNDLDRLRVLNCSQACDDSWLSNIPRSIDDRPNNDRSYWPIRIGTHMRLLSR